MKYLPMPVKNCTPYRHQQEAYQKALEMFDSGQSHGYGLLFECGCGKTITAIAVAGRLFLAQKVKRVLVIAPKSVLPVWEDEFFFANFDHNLAVLSGTGAKKADTLRHLNGSNLNVCVVNYESARILLPELLAWKADLIIADEGHRLKNHASQQSKACHKLSDKAKYRLLLTGTLIGNHAESLWSEWRFLEKSVFGNVGYYAWRARYFESVGHSGFQFRLKKSKEQEYTEKLHSIAYSVRKEDALDLPETQDIIRHITLEKDAQKLYTALAKECYATIEMGTPQTPGNSECSVTNVLTKILRLLQITGGFITDDSGKSTMVSTAKLDCLTELIETLREENKQVVVIAKFTAEITAIKERLDKMGVSHSAMTGETKDRAEQVKQFQEGKTAVFIGQISCAAVGITLHSASDLIFYSLDYSTENHIQARSRTHRSGQRNKCSYYYLLCKGTIDEQVLDALNAKEDFSRRITDAVRNGNKIF